MNEKLQYASMLEIPVNTCNLTSFTTKKKRKKRKLSEEQVKEILLEKVNEQSENQPFIEQEQLVNGDSEYYQEVKTEECEDIAEKHIKTKKPFKFSIIGVQLVVIGLLIATILITNTIYADSGINVFLRGVFSNNSAQVQTDDRLYSEFAPVIAMGNNQDLTISDGVISFEGKGSVYSPCDGVVSAIIENEQGQFTIEIMHSDNFKSIISGVERVYVLEGQKVYSRIPVGYLQDNGASMCFSDNSGAVITDYQIENGLVRWAV